MSKQIGDYTVHLDQDIGRGAFGNVHKATTSDGRTVAAKKISLTDHPDAHIHEALNFYRRPPEHENLIELIDFQIEGGNFWLFMQYAQHGDLDKYFRDYSPLLVDIKKKILLMKQIACGIAYLHEQDIVHRDIKPCNILVCGGQSPEEAVLKIADFGLARYLNPNANTSAMSSVAGTESFKAPEFWRRGSNGKICYHRNVDTFAAGLTFLAMLQATEGRPLIPTIEGTTDLETEGCIQIGLVMFYRQARRQPTVHVVEDREGDGSITRGVKQVIRCMVQMVPEYRKPMQEVHEVLSNENDLIREVRYLSLP